MPSRLENFRRHCERMAAAEHKPECPSLGPKSRPIWRMSDDYTSMIWLGMTPAPPHCDGCNSADDRALFARLATEVESYQAALFEETA